MKLDLGDISLPIDFATQTAAILARKRVGKTYTGSVIAEELAERNLPFVVLDPTGAWWGLASAYPIVIIGGAHGHVPLEPTAGKVIADLVVDHPGFYVIDLSLTASNADQDRFALDFAERLYRAKESKRFPLHLFVDEADSFAPQRPFSGQERMLGAFEAIVRRGGIRGLGITMITQRPAVLNKNVLTQCEMLIVLQMTGPQDQDAIDDWVHRNGTKEERDRMMSSLASLEIGEAWLWSPSWMRVFKKIRIRKRRSFNSSATPKVGDKTVSPPNLKPVDLAKLGQDIAATVERAKDNDPAALRKKIAGLEKQLAAPKPVPAPPVVERVEVPVLGPEQVQVLVSVQEAIASTRTDLNARMDDLSGILARVRDLVALRLPKAPARALARQRPATVRPPAASVKPRRDPTSIDGEAGDLARGERAVLTACAQFDGGLDRSQITVLTGYKRSTRDTYLFRLAQKGYVETAGDRMAVTAEGIAALGQDFEPLPTGDQLRAHWLAKLPKGEREILDVLIADFPDPVSREVITEKTGYQRSTRDT